MILKCYLTMGKKVRRKRKPGGGRKKGPPTKVIRVPVSKVEAVKELIKKYAVVVTILAIAL